MLWEVCARQGEIQPRAIIVQTMSPGLDLRTMNLNSIFSHTPHPNEQSYSPNGAPAGERKFRHRHGKKQLTSHIVIYETEFMFYYHRRAFLCGIEIWILATVALRLAGQYLLRPRNPEGVAVLFAVSFPLMAWITRGLCARFRLPPEQWPMGANSIALPTLLLDPFSSALFPVLFPNIAPELAGVFGGWMLWCCAGAFVGAIFRPEMRA